MLVWECDGIFEGATTEAGNTIRLFLNYGQLSTAK